MEDEIGKLKSVFRSLVVCSPKQVDVRSLMRDYRSMIGSPVPFRKYGYSNPVEFLHERFSDCFLFSGVTSNPVLTLIVPDRLKHIDKFVQKQKSSSVNKFTPKRRSVPEELVNINRDKSVSYRSKGHLSSQPIVNKTVANDSSDKSFSELNERTKSHETVTKSHVAPSKSYVTVNRPNIRCRKLNGSDEHEIINNNSHDESHTLHNRDKHVVQSKESLIHAEENYRKDEIIDTHIDNTDAVKNFLKKRLPLYDSEQYLHEDSVEHCTLTQHDTDSGRHTSSSGSSAKMLELERLKQKILNLIAEAPDGVWCTDLLRLYKERYHQELNFSRFGYTSIISLVYCLEQEVQITRPDMTGDWLLQERRRATPAPPALRPRRFAPLSRTHLSDDADAEDALPGIDFDPDVFPEDCMHFMESIPSVSVSDFRPGAMVEVMIGEVYSPSHFWFIRVGENYNIAMEDMMDEMTHYYRNEGQNRVLARGAVQVGHYCASLYEKDWHRSLIVKIIDSDTVKVRHIDYGTVDTVAVSGLRALRREWAALGAQACRARLAGVRPPAAGWRWPHASSAAFLALVSDRRLVANVVALDERERVAEVVLVDTARRHDVCVGRELVRAGHADLRRDSALGTLSVYLFPRFEALESGDTPNYAEVTAYLRDGIALDYVRAYRDHVPLPPDHAPTTPDPPHHAPDPPHHAPDPPHHAPDPPHHSPTPPDHSPALLACIPLLLPDPEVAPLISFDSSPENTPPPPPVDPPESEEFGPTAQTEGSTSSTSESPPTSRSPPTSGTPPTSEAPTTPGAPPTSILRSTSGPPVTSGAPASSEVPSTSDAPQSSERAAPPPTRISPSGRPALLPTPTSYLSPHAPAYVPGAPYTPASQSPAAYGCSPPPPYGTPSPPPAGVTLSLEECETYRALSHVNPAAAHWFIVGAMGRASARHNHPVYPTHHHTGPIPPQVLPPPPHMGLHVPHMGPHPPHVGPHPPHMGPHAPHMGPHPPQFFPVGPPPQMAHPGRGHPPVRIRPPPGFGSL